MCKNRHVMLALFFGFCIINAGEWYVVGKLSRKDVQNCMSVTTHDIKRIARFVKGAHEHYLAYLRNDDYIVAHYQSGPTNYARIACTRYIRHHGGYAQVALDPLLYFWFKSLAQRARL